MKALVVRNSGDVEEHELPFPTRTVRVAVRPDPVDFRRPDREMIFDAITHGALMKTKECSAFSTDGETIIYIEEP
jgi:hypothetical protein